MKAQSQCDPSEHFASMFPKGQEWFSPKETGNIIGRSDQFVRDSFSTGKLMGHSSNGIAPKGEEKKNYLRVHRDAIIMYLMESANYTADSFMENLETIIRRRSDYQLLRLEKVIRDRLYSDKKRWIR